jgi:restriction endonuclease S subunit
MEQAKKEVNTKLEIISKQNYPLKKLSNLIEIIGGGTPDTKKSEYWNGGIPWISVADFNTGKRFVSSSEKTISELGLNNSSIKYLQVGDLIISARGTVTVGVVAQLAIPMTFNQSCYGLCGIDEVDNGYLYYVLKREVAQFKDNAYGSTFGSITTKTFDSIKIAVPPIDVQLSIVTEIEQIETKITAAQQIIDSAASKKQDILKQYL